MVTIILIKILVIFFNLQVLSLAFDRVLFLPRHLKLVCNLQDIPQPICSALLVLAMKPKAKYALQDHSYTFYEEKQIRLFFEYISP
jgi:hypothetical protein